MYSSLLQRCCVHGGFLTNGAVGLQYLVAQRADDWKVETKKTLPDGSTSKISERTVRREENVSEEEDPSFFIDPFFDGIYLRSTMEGKVFIMPKTRTS